MVILRGSENRSEIEAVSAWLSKLERDMDFLQWDPALARVLKMLATTLQARQETRPLSTIALKLALNAKLSKLNSRLCGLIPTSQLQATQLSSQSDSARGEPSTKAEDTVEKRERARSESGSELHKEEHIANPELRGHVCRTVMKILKKNGFTEAQSQKLALKIERKLRLQDPLMSSKYRLLYKRMVRDIKKVRPEALDRLS